MQIDQFLSESSLSLFQYVTKHSLNANVILVVDFFFEISLLCVYLEFLLQQSSFDVNWYRKNLQLSDQEPTDAAGELEFCLVKTKVGTKLGLV